jgi:hypothetical protein
MQVFLQRAVSFFVGVAVGVTGCVIWSKVGDFEVGKDPLAYVDTIDDTFPIDGDPAAMLSRLDRDSAQRWLAAEIAVRSTDGKPLKELQALRRVVLVPEGTQWPLQAVLTNALDPSSTRRLGTLYVVWFRDSYLAASWLRLDQPIFTDPAVEQARKTYWAGQLVIYYSPPAGGADRSDVVRQWATEVVDCPRTVGPCGVSQTG